MSNQVLRRQVFKCQGNCHSEVAIEESRRQQDIPSSVKICVRSGNGSSSPTPSAITGCTWAITCSCAGRQPSGTALNTGPTLSPSDSWSTPAMSSERTSTRPGRSSNTSASQRSSSGCRGFCCELIGEGARGTDVGVRSVKSTGRVFLFSCCYCNPM